MRRNLVQHRAAVQQQGSKQQAGSAARMKVAVIAFGTRGDVQPLIILAGGIATRSPWCSEVVVVSHHQHGDLVKSLLGACVGGSTANLATFAPVDSPAVIWKGRSVPPASELALSAFHWDAKNHPWR